MHTECEINKMAHKVGFQKRMQAEDENLRCKKWWPYSILAFFVLYIHLYDFFNT